MTKISNYEFITTKELADTLEISLCSAYALLRSGEIKSFKIGTHYKIPVTSVDDYIHRQCGLPIPQGW